MQSGSTSSSAPRSSRLYSFWTATNRGPPFAFASSSASVSWAGEKFEQPIARVSPSATSCCIAPSVSAIGVTPSGWW